MKILTDEQVIRRALKGSADDFRELMLRHQDSVFRLAYRILRRREEAEDAVQETFLQIFRSLGDYTERGRFWPWARRIAVNICLKRLPRELPSDDVADLLDSAQPLDNPVETEALKRAELDDVRRAIDGLPAEYRTVVVLRYEEELSYKEIAELTGEPLTTVQVRLHRAKKMLTQRLAVIVNDGVL